MNGDRPSEYDAESACSRRRLLGLGLGTALGAGLGALLARAPALASAAPRLRPPGALDEPRFLAACLRCGQCVLACPQECLRLAGVPCLGAGASTPYLEPRRMACNLCADQATLLCIEACPSGALTSVTDLRAIRMGTAVLDQATCLAYQGVVCRSCWHACPFPDEAIRFDGRLRPEVEAESCIGCGLCEHACPNQRSSIVVRPRTVGGSA